MRVVEVICYPSFIDTLSSIARQQGVEDYWISQSTTDGRLSMKILVKTQHAVDLVDRLETLFDGSPKTCVLVHPVIASDEPMEMHSFASAQPAIDVMTERSNATGGMVSAGFWVILLVLITLPALGIGFGLARGYLLVVLFLLLLMAAELFMISRWISRRMRFL